MSRAEITTPEIIPDESVIELSLRPQRLSEVHRTGPREGVLRILDARVAPEPLDPHALFFRPTTASAKTTLAELKRRARRQHSQHFRTRTSRNPATWSEPLTNLREGDILFIDEIHRLRPIIKSSSIRRDGGLPHRHPPLRRTQGADDQHERREVHAHRRDHPARHAHAAHARGSGSGCGSTSIRPPTPSRSSTAPAEVMQVEIDETGRRRSQAIARNSGVANRLLRRIRDFAQVRAGDIIDRKVATDALQLLGRPVQARRYGLARPRDHHREVRGGPVGVAPIAAAVGEDAGTLEEGLRAVSRADGFLQRTPMDAVATRAGVPALRVQSAEHERRRAGTDAVLRLRGSASTARGAIVISPQCSRALGPESTGRLFAPRSVFTT